MDISIPGTTALLLMILVFVLVIAIIIVGRSVFRSRQNSGLTEKYQGKKWSSPLLASNKYPDVNVFKSTGPILKFGFAA